MFKKFSIYLTVLALIIGPGLVAAPAFADSDKGEGHGKKIEKQEKKLALNVFKNWLKHSDDDEDEDHDYKDDDRLPPGLRRAPGIEKRVEDGKGLPFGWWFRLFGSGHNGNGTTTPPTFNFVLSNVNSSVSTSSATISWNTNRASDSKVFYSTTSPATISNSLVSNGSLVFNHSLALSGLEPATTYYYFVTSTTNGGETATSSAGSFTTNTLPTPDTEAPEIVFSTIIDLTESSARFIWVTDESSNSKVWVSTTTPVDLSGTANSESSTLAYYHNLLVSGLSASTTYYYVLSSADANGNAATTTGSFITH